MPTSRFDRYAATAPKPLPPEERERLIRELPAIGAASLLELDDRITGRDHRQEVRP